jgi:hypothetical protein
MRGGAIADRTTAETLSPKAEPGRATRLAPVRPTEVGYFGMMEALVFRCTDGRIVGVPLQQLKLGDSSPIRRVSVDRWEPAVFIELFSGEVLQVAWETVVSHVIVT